VKDYQAALKEGFVSSEVETQSGATATIATTTISGANERDEGHERRFHHLCLAPSGMNRVDIERLRQHSSCLFYGSDDTSIGAD
jgi:hypothetical protein